MAKGWTPPKGISVIYKGKGHRKKPKSEEHHSKDEKETKDKNSD
jgi:hypothetical protein